METESAELAATRITHSVVMVDDTVASRWLERNAQNRPIRANVVDRYRREMLAGRWTFAGDPIRFNCDGDLADGQHRLTAIVGTDVTIPMLVIRGLAPEARAVMDQGAKRSGGDQLAMLGYKNATLLHSSVRQYIAWTEGFLFRDNRIASSQITTPWVEQWVAEHPADVEFLSASVAALRSIDAPPSVSGAAAIRFHQIDPAAAAQFFALLSRGAGTEGHPIVTLDKRLARIRREGLNIPSRDLLAMFIQAWNAWRENRSMSKFQRPRGGSWNASNYPVPR